MTVVVCQTKPELFKKKENIARFDKVISQLQPGHNIDLVIFPEMSFSGYNF